MYPHSVAIVKFNDDSLYVSYKGTGCYVAQESPRPYGGVIGRGLQSLGAADRGVHLLLRVSDGRVPLDQGIPPASLYVEDVAELEAVDVVEVEGLA